IAEKLPNGAMLLIGARFDCGVQDCGARAGKLRAKASGLNLEFFNGVNGRQNDEVRAIQEVHRVRIVVNAIEQIVVLGGPIAIGGEGAAGSVAARVGLGSVHTSSELGQESEIPSIERKIINTT